MASSQGDYRSQNHQRQSQKEKGQMGRGEDKGEREKQEERGETENKTRESREVTERNYNKGESKTKLRNIYD